MRRGNMKNNKLKRLAELKMMEYKLKSIFSKNQFHKKLYEKSNKDNKSDINDEFVVLDDKNSIISAEITNDFIAYVSPKCEFDFRLLDKKTIPIVVLWELYDTIKILINIIEYECSLDSESFEKIYLNS